MPLTAGTRLGPYEIIAPLGVGGMGEVYRARDARLGREVAIKVLPEAFAADAERVARFQREAQVLASLNHPNIAAIYGIEDDVAGSKDPAYAGHYVRALILELVEGDTLAELIARRAGPSGPAGLPLDEAIPIARQMAEALEAAHEHGIIHRDLKPANVRVTRDGVVKVLDFGLAKLAAGPAEAGHYVPDGRSVRLQADVTASPTLTSPAATRMGMILGTAAYMSPEQARGKTVDKRTDIWAFGCTLFEMLTARRPFAGDDVTDVIAAIVRAEPPWDALPADTPPRIVALIRRCVEKDARERLRDIGEARLEIQAALREPASADVSGRTHRTRSARAVGATWALIGLVAGILTASLLVSRLDPAADGARPVARFAIVPDDLPSGYLFNEIAITPDGGRIV